MIHQNYILTNSIVFPTKFKYYNNMNKIKLKSFSRRSQISPVWGTRFDGTGSHDVSTNSYSPLIPWSGQPGSESTNGGHLLHPSCPLCPGQGNRVRSPLTGVVHSSPHAHTNPGVLPVSGHIHIYFVLLSNLSTLFRVFHSFLNDFSFFIIKSWEFCILFA